MIIVLYFTLKDHFSDVIQQLLNLNKLWLLVAIIFMGIYGLLRALSLHLVIKNFKKDFKFFKTARNLLITQFFNGVTPFSSGGQPAQIYFFKKEGVDIPTSTSIVIQNFIVYQIVLVIYGTIAITINHFCKFFPDVSLLKKLILLGFSINALVMLGLLLISFGKKLNKFIVEKSVNILHKLKIIKHRLRTINRFNLTIDKFHDSATQIFKNKKTFIQCFICNFVAFAFLYSLPLIILYSMGDYNSFNILNSIVACGYVMIIGAFVPIPGGSGGLEYAFVKFFGNYITGSILSAILLIWRFITYYLGIIVGAITFNIDRRLHE